MLAPVPPPQTRRLLLEPITRQPLQPLDEGGERSLRRVLDMRVDVVFADRPLEDVHVLGVADLQEQAAAAHLDVPGQHRVAVLRHPHQVRRQPRQCVHRACSLASRVTSSTPRSV